MSLGHVLAPPGNHLIFLWPASVTAAAGVILAMVSRRRVWRRLWAWTAVLGVATTVIIYVLEPAYPAPPPFGIRLTMATSPGDIAVMVCPVTTDASQPLLPGSGRLLDVYVDGRVAAEGGSSAYVVRVPPGRHSLSAELVQANHVAFLPAERTPTVGITVAPGSGTALPAVTC